MEHEGWRPTRFFRDSACGNSRSSSSSQSPLSDRVELEGAQMEGGDGGRVLWLGEIMPARVRVWFIDRCDTTATTRVESTLNRIDRAFNTGR